MRVGQGCVDTVGYRYVGRRYGYDASSECQYAEWREYRVDKEAIGKSPDGVIVNIMEEWTLAILCN